MTALILDFLLLFYLTGVIFLEIDELKPNYFSAFTLLFGKSEGCSLG